MRAEPAMTAPAPHPPFLPAVNLPGPQAGERVRARAQSGRARVPLGAAGGGGSLFSVAVIHPLFLPCR